jgi:predicted Na+-dependent transporter
VLIRPSLLLNLFVAVVMFSIGLRVSGAELLNVLRDRALFVRTLLANCFLIPAIGFLLVNAFPLTPKTRIGILLLAAIPGTPIALQFTPQAKTRLAFAAALTFVLSVVSIAMTSLAIEVIPESVSAISAQSFSWLPTSHCTSPSPCALVCWRLDARRKLPPGWYYPWAFSPRLSSSF